MVDFGTRSGSGSVEQGDKSIPVTYRFSVTAIGDRINSSGSLGHDDALDTGMWTLRLEDGEPVSILIKNVGSDGTWFVLSDRLPKGLEKQVERYIDNLTY